MKLYTIKEDFAYTGGGIWVLFAELTSADGAQKLYATVSDDSLFYYENEEDWNNCENHTCGGWFEDAETAELPRKGISKALINRYNQLYEKHKHD